MRQDVYWLMVILDGLLLLWIQSYAVIYPENRHSSFHRKGKTLKFVRHRLQNSCLDVVTYDAVLKIQTIMPKFFFLLSRSFFEYGSGMNCAQLCNKFGCIQGRIHRQLPRNG
eukprot:XP_001706626.1 Hypothetical protein GL50803_31996 [Giardia lamblia ATCC 50803]